MFHLIVNGLHNGEKIAEQIEAVKKVFLQAGKELEVHITEYPGHAKELAAQLTAYGQHANLIAMGGDGTLHEVLNGIENVELCTLGIIPIGSGNDFARAAGISQNPAIAAATVAFRAPSAIDYIQLESGLRSINAVGAGIDVDVLERATAGKKTGKGKYFSAFLKSLKYYKSTTSRVSWDGGEEREITGLIVGMGNGTQIGGGIKLFPKAKINDGYMDLVIVDYLSKVRTFFAFLKLVTGRVHKVKEVTYVKCKKAYMIPVDGNAKIQAEGEIYDGVPLRAELISGKLKFYLPENND